MEICRTIPPRVLSGTIFFIVLWCRFRPTDILWWKCFAIILDKKSDSFKQDEDNDNTHHLFRYVYIIPIAPYWTGVGYCVGLFVLGFVRTSYQINERLHTWTEVCFLSIWYTVIIYYFLVYLIPNSSQTYICWEGLL